MFGFGHRVYKNFDPRANVIRKVAEEVFELVGRDPLIDVAVALEKEARKDEYFVKRNLYPNVDFYSGLVYRALGFPPEFFTVLFAVPRAAGYLAHWRESLTDPDVKIMRPQQIYQGVWLRPYPSIDARAPCSGEDRMWNVAPSNASRRRLAGETVEMAASRYHAYDGGGFANLASLRDSTARGAGSGERPRACPRPAFSAGWSRGTPPAASTRSRARASEEASSSPFRRGDEPRLDGKRCFFSSGASRVSLIRRRSLLYLRLYVHSAHAIRFRSRPRCLPVHHARPRKPTELPVPRGLSGVLRLPRALEHRPAPRDARVAHPRLALEVGAVLVNLRQVLRAVRPVQRRVHARPPLAVPRELRLVRAPAQRFADRARARERAAPHPVVDQRGALVVFAGVYERERLHEPADHPDVRVRHAVLANEPIVRSRSSR